MKRIYAVLIDATREVVYQGIEEHFIPGIDVLITLRGLSRHILVCRTETLTSLVAMMIRLLESGEIRTLTLTEPTLTQIRSIISECDEEETSLFFLEAAEMLEDVVLAEFRKERYCVLRPASKAETEMYRKHGRPVELKQGNLYILRPVDVPIDSLSFKHFGAMR